MGMKHQDVKIKESLMPKNMVEKDIFVSRRLAYDLKMTVSEAISVLLVFVLDL
jgi:hypothetical protein